jgi:hypothetical protein
MVILIIGKEKVHVLIWERLDLPFNNVIDLASSLSFVPIFTLILNCLWICQVLTCILV